MKRKVLIGGLAAVAAVVVAAFVFVVSGGLDRTTTARPRGAGEQVVTVELIDSYAWFDITPDVIEVAAGTELVLDVVNRAGGVHDLEVGGAADATARARRVSAAGARRDHRVTARALHHRRPRQRRDDPRHPRRVVPRRRGSPRRGCRVTGADRTEQRPERRHRVFAGPHGHGRSVMATLDATTVEGRRAAPGCSFGQPVKGAGCEVNGLFVAECVARRRCASNVGAPSDARVAPWPASPPTNDSPPAHPKSTSSSTATTRPSSRACASLAGR